jgi:DNA-directed RNA polymerase specialized sigma24 family protein
MLDPRFREDAFRDVLEQVTRRLLDLTTDKDDFAQRRFWVWLDRVTFNTVRVHFRRQAEEKVTDSLDQLTETEASSPSPHDQLLHKEALGALDVLEPNERSAFLLRHYDGWKIESKDPNVLTISKYLNRTPETIRNWLRNADAKLKDWRGGVK